MIYEPSRGNALKELSERDEPDAPGSYRCVIAQLILPRALSLGEMSTRPAVLVRLSSRRHLVCLPCHRGHL